MRPIYENSNNIAAEGEVAKKLAAHFKVEVTKMRKLFQFDWAELGEHGIIRAFWEIKCRTNPVNKYPTYMISGEKIRWALDTTMLHDAKCLIAVQWADALGYYEITPENQYLLFIGGRNDRGDDYDREPVCLIDIKRFTMIEPGE